MRMRASLAGRLARDGDLGGAELAAQDEAEEAAEANGAEAVEEADDGTAAAAANGSQDAKRKGPEPVPELVTMHREGPGTDILFPSDAVGRCRSHTSCCVCSILLPSQSSVYGHVCQHAAWETLTFAGRQGADRRICCKPLCAIREAPAALHHSRLQHVVPHESL